jgi:aspartyl-tRNA(Asn)/glutamyl-tRNA(Gln) amidotransferase subunit B
MEFEAVIGLEVHAQLLTKSKIFCSCSTAFGSPANANTCPVCLGFPGALPVLNREAVIMAVKAAIGLECQINPVSIFARKNYFYPDLPKGYQISQFDQPLAEHGVMVLRGGGDPRTIRIKRIHMEEDAGKSIHDGFADSSRFSYIDLNRSGTPLVEIVSEPEIHAPSEAYEYLSRLKMILEYLEVCDGNMEEGSLRCDANVSIRPRGETRLGTKIELKNLNSFRFVEKALEYEIARQIQVVQGGGSLFQETRLWNADEQRTYSMRSKEEAHDYRYFPEPDLPPLQVSEAWQAEIRAAMPELPEARKARFIRDYEIPEYDAGVLTSQRRLADYYEKTVQSCRSPKAASNWIMGDLLRDLKEFNLEIRNSPVLPEQLAELITLIDSGEISGKMGKEVFEGMFRGKKSASQVIEEKGLKQISDHASLEKIIQEVIAQNPEAVKNYQAGKKASFGFFVGQVMKATKGQANPQLVNDLLKTQLDA